MQLRSALRRAAVGACAALLLAQNAAATWSIVAVDTRTGEVVVAAATCLSNFNLKAFLPVIQVGKGAASAQASVDLGAVNRMVIWQGFQDGVSPQGILARLEQYDAGHESHQYGIVTLAEQQAPATFSGLGCLDAVYGLADEFGDVRYAIQGNILTGVGVIYYAESALRSTPGDLSQRVMAAMEAARSIGGDGRCSCSNSAPTSCGAPPANFEYSAYCSFIVLARMGDLDGVCQPTGGCANGKYFLDLRVISNNNGPEPVLQLQTDYDAWRTSKAGFADHILTRVESNAHNLVADGVSRTRVDVQLVNIDGALLTNSTAALEVVDNRSGAPVATLGPITDHGAGHFSFELTATTQPGDGSWTLNVVHPGLKVRLWPDYFVRVDPLAELHCGFDRVSVTEEVAVPLTINLGAAHAGRAYHVLGSASGTTPGVVFTSTNIPLNRDAFFVASLLAPNVPPLVATQGTLDAQGRAQATFLAAPGQLAPLVGRRIDWVSLFPASDEVSNLAGFEVIP